MVLLSPNLNIVSLGYPEKTMKFFIISLFIFTDIFANYFSNISKLKNFLRPLYALYIMVFVYGIKELEVPAVGLAPGH